ncbi:MAG: DUF3429 domain-containing protein [Rhizobiales bacterium TMED83]|jgi:hypothetical protein|nr:hypothetical protein [Rhodobiaceae bacterium]RPF94768.1 MAG: DUF3429 domain-containing protein [Rhizobiales bacterium TMED83]
MIGQFHHIPRSALILGVLGLVPFVAGGVLVWLPQVQNIAPTIPPLVFFYAALIVSFLGGVRWGAAMQNRAMGAVLARELCASVVPTLITLACYILSLPAAIAMLLVLIISQGLVDILAARQNKLVGWYAPLRLLLSGVAGAALVSTLAYLATQ